MAAAQRQLQTAERRGLPVAIPQKTQKDRLYNDLIELVSELKLKWRNNPSSNGTSFLKKLMNVFWYLDGHHDTIEEKSSKIPGIFHHFNSYNCPQASKHRKRTKENLKCEELSAHSFFLQEAIYTSWMQKGEFRTFQGAIEGLKIQLRGIWHTWSRKRNTNNYITRWSNRQLLLQMFSHTLRYQKKSHP